MTMKSTRKPGSQVAPNERPNFTDGRTATTHSKVPLDQATAGKRYRVRDRAWANVWGVDLPFGEANLLKEKVITSGKSTTARVEDMDIPPPDWYVAQEANATAPDLEIGAPHEGSEQCSSDLTAQPVPEGQPLTVQYSIDGVGGSVTVPKDGLLIQVPTGTQLKINGAFASAPVSVRKGDVCVAELQHPDLAAGQAAARAAAAPVAAAAAARASAKRPAPRDKTKTPPPPRNPNPPRDKTASRGPVHVRLSPAPAASPEPPPSPLKVATQLDGKPISEDTITDDSLVDLIPDLGGAPSDADIAHAERQRADEQAKAKAKASGH